MKLYLVAGEASGDACGAELMRSLLARREGIEIRGFGGPQMAALAGPGMVHDWIGRAAVIGIIEVVKDFLYFRRQFAVALEEIAREKPDAVVLIDYPGFNLRLAATLKKAASPTRIIYYVAPQVWVWKWGRSEAPERMVDLMIRPWARRIERMTDIPAVARVIDLMICILPFEKPLYDEQSGLKTVFVGHPILDLLKEKRTAGPREEDLLGLFPGSREREVRDNFPVQIEAAALLRQTHPGLRIEAAAVSDEMRERMEEIARRYPGLNCNVTVKAAHDLMQRATAGMVASGTATLEAAYFGLPFVVLYKAAWLNFFLLRRVLKVKWLALPNILADREVVREFLQEEARPKEIAAEVGRLLDDRQARMTFHGNVQPVISKLGELGASGRAAEVILSALGT